MKSDSEEEGKREMMKKVLFSAVLVMVLLSVTAVYGADKRDFTFVNASGYPIKFVGINPPGDEDWNENELNGTLEDKASFRVDFEIPEKGCVWNIKVTWADDNRFSIFRGINLCNIKIFTVKNNLQGDAASYTID